jgi:hypothetical protein
MALRSHIKNARCANVLADEDSRVAAAGERVERTVADMARKLSPDRRSCRLDLPVAEVGRMTTAAATTVHLAPVTEARAHPGHGEQ